MFCLVSITFTRASSVTMVTTTRLPQLSQPQTTSYAWAVQRCFRCLVKSWPKQQLRLVNHSQRAPLMVLQMTVYNGMSTAWQLPSHDQTRAVQMCFLMTKKLTVKSKTKIQVPRIPKLVLGYHFTDGLTHELCACTFSGYNATIINTWCLRLLFWILSQSIILCTSLMKPYYAENGNIQESRHLPVLQPQRFHWNRVFHKSKCSVLYQE